MIDDVRSLNPYAEIVEAESPVTLDAGPPLVGKRVLVVEDGPTLTHGGMAFGAGTVGARQAGAAELVDPRPWAVGSIADTFARYPQIGAVLPALGYGDEQLRELEETIDRVECDVVVTGTPFDLGRVIATRHPLRHARYELRERGRPTLQEVIAPIERLARTSLTATTG